MFLIPCRLYSYTYNYFSAQAQRCKGELVSTLPLLSTHTGSDFNATIIERVVEPTSSGMAQEFEFSIPILSDSKLEGDEVFLILLNVVSTEEVGVPRRCAVARIQGTSSANQEGIKAHNYETTGGTHSY